MYIIDEEILQNHMSVLICFIYVYLNFIKINPYKKGNFNQTWPLRLRGFYVVNIKDHALLKKGDN